MSSVREHTITEIPTGQNRNPPILVHCSTGVGRTGLAVLSDLLLYTLDHNQVYVYFVVTENLGNCKTNFLFMVSVMLYFLYEYDNSFDFKSYIIL